MSIRLRFTLLYNAILALTLAIFGAVLYSNQAQTTYTALKNDLLRSSRMLENSLKAAPLNFPPGLSMPPASPSANTRPNQPPQPLPFDAFSSDQAFQQLREREIARVLDAEGNLVASPFGRSQDALPLSAAGVEALAEQGEWWETADVLDQRMLIYSRTLNVNGQATYILQVARPLTERDRSLRSLGATLIVASLATLVVAFGIGWAFSGITLQPIQRITQTASAIGAENNFTQRVAYSGPPDEVGQLATTLNSMLARIQEAYQRVARSLEMQRNFVADVSHELRTPLTTLRGNIGLLRRTPPVPPAEQADILCDMEDETNRLIRLVNDLLILARADAGRNLAREPVNIHEVIDDVRRQARQLEPGRAINSDCPAEAQFLGDRDAFKQILLILVDNAIKHSPGAVHISAEAAGSQVVVIVRDNGPGIAPEKLERVFDRFYRGEESALTPGFGLGLPIAKALVEGQGGNIQIESRPGEGSALTLRLPTA